MASIFISLGSNIDAEKNLKTAANLLRSRWPPIRFSSVYQTKALGYEDQPDFLNAAATFESEMPPNEIHALLLSIERTLGKKKPLKDGPRTIDLDFLLCGDEVIETPTLIVPHPRMHERRFVLEPLCEVIDPKTRHPLIGKSWEEFHAECLNQDSARLHLQV
ncbi:2-amino-4-hydroxy-6-hydroxymethyldihydropteridine diphosphokinase [Candidatus Peregrinibacteria bacterium]|nr:2-amino-4-hydroxy-6-hydroxymethyldihydropteridine diphosphokinase [Candidatus Peregrinibacteria bacterium]MBI3816881.1 2-amino-4-hydroxy-6-hydroxymethyldihydropteridine diphosphokinase [Candidatus Peregrinibacteria bacterium]